MAAETKIVISHSAESCIVGIKLPECDPVFYMPKGDLAAVIAEIPKEVEDTKLQWADKKQYPKSALPPAPEPAAVRKGATIESTATVKKTAPPAQPSFDL